MQKRLLFYFFRYGIILVGFLFAFHFSYSQNPGEWMWIHGSNTTNQPGTYGTQGVSNPLNVPPAMYEPCEWTDLNGNFWFYGGLDVTYPSGAFNDLWKYNPALNEWTWMSGTKTQGDAGVFGVQGISSPVNRPPGLSWGAASWVDLNGNLWMFGGALLYSAYSDLWKYDISTNQWTWMKGMAALNGSGRYGTKGVPDINNNPGSRLECASAWTDNAGDLWLFGGSTRNDMWRFNIPSNTWTWMKGDSVTGSAAVYGAKGVEAPSNNPVSGFVYSRWKDKNGDLWLFTPAGILWRYRISTNNWTWITGNPSSNVGVYGTKCIANTANQPQGHNENRAAWTDVNGNFWVFGGGSYNDLWQYNVGTGEWKWVSGSNLAGPTGNWGTKGVSAPLNVPNGRMGSVAWMGADCRLYLFGGCNPGYTLYHNDLWSYKIDPSCSGSACTALPHADFISSDTIFCEESGKCIDFFDQSTGSPTSWQWFFPGAIPDTSSQQNPTGICYYAPGTYSVKLIVSNSGGKDTLIVSPGITFATTAAAPFLTISGDTIFCSHAAAYQWYLNGIPISLATDSFCVINGAGVYSVLITDENGCSRLSAGLSVTVKELTGFGGIKIYPNPVKESLVIRHWSLGKARVSIYNVLGEMVFESDIMDQSTEINVTQLAKGIYIVELNNTEQAYRTKFVKE